MVKKDILFDISRQILSDIELVLHYNSSGSFYLPEDVGGELTYRFLNQDLIVEFDWKEDGIHGDNVVVGDYYNEEYSIKITLVTVKDINEETVSNIAEVLVHELTHWMQELDGYDFPKKEPEDFLGYYLQPHEIEAQYFGFLFQSEYLNKSLVEVVDLWFEKYGKFHQDTDIDFVKSKLIEKLQEKSHTDTTNTI